MGASSASDGILGLYWDNGKENGDYYVMGYILDLYRG